MSPARAYVLAIQIKGKEGLKTDQDRAELGTTRLAVKIEQFEERIREIHPVLEDIAVPTYQNAAEAILTLPSSLSTEQIAEFGLQDLAQAERKLRIGACFDFIGKLKDALGVRSFLTRHSRQQQGYNGATRSQEAIRRAEANVKRHGRSYRCSWRALNGLGVPDTDRQGLQELHESDMTILGQWLEGQQYRYRGTQLPWIWTLLPIGEHDDDDEVGANVDAWNWEGTWPTHHVHTSVLMHDAL